MLSGTRPARAKTLFARVPLRSATLDQIGEVDLRKVELKAGTHVAVCAQTESKAAEDVARAAAQARGCDIPWAGLDLWSYKTSTKDISRISPPVLQWLRKSVPVQPSTMQIATGDAVLHTGGLLESVRFGPPCFRFGRRRRRAFRLSVQLAQVDFADLVECRGSEAELAQIEVFALGRRVPLSISTSRVSWRRSCAHSSPARTGAGPRHLRAEPPRGSQGRATQATSTRRLAPVVARNQFAASSTLRCQAVQ